VQRQSLPLQCVLGDLADPELQGGKVRTGPRQVDRDLFMLAWCFPTCPSRISYNHCVFLWRGARWVKRCLQAKGPRRGRHGAQSAFRKVRLSRHRPVAGWSPSFKVSTPW
jgi:hypothetical protein